MLINLLQEIQLVQNLDVNRRLVNKIDKEWSISFSLNLFLSWFSFFQKNCSFFFVFVFGVCFFNNFFILFLPLSFFSWKENKDALLFIEKSLKGLMYHNQKNLSIEAKHCLLFLQVFILFFLFPFLFFWLSLLENSEGSNVPSSKNQSIEAKHFLRFLKILAKQQVMLIS